MQKFNIFSRLQFSPDFKLLCVYHTIVSLGDGMIGLFLPIFLFQSFGLSIIWVIVFFIVGYGLYGLLIPFGAMMMNKVGVKRGIILGRAFVIPFFLGLYYLQSDPLLFAILANVALLFYRLLYWIPYQTSFVEFTDGRYRGRQLAWLSVFKYLVGIGAPILAGFILMSYSFDVLYVMGMVIAVFALIPLTGLTEVKAEFEYSYFQSFKEMLKKKNRRWGMAFAADGAQSLVGVAVWPVFIFTVLEEQYLAVGAVTALVIIATIILQLIMGTYTDKLRKRSLIRVSSLIYAVGWILKAFVATAFQIFLVGSFHSFAEVMVRTPFDTRFYSLSADRGPYRDEYTVLHSISINTGRVVMGIILIILISMLGLQVAFVLAALASILLNLL
ncbi:hypothetical protein MYX06_05065 [Patescibacteria group bacterium AH-259-L05]|nr:hypothetical protein [Patescibacteria group bacterium AH-259-L05]